VWCHGKYTLNPNGSITMVPFGDGYQQVQEPCGAVSDFLQNYNDTENYQYWQTFIDPVYGPKLHLFQFDGTPLAPQFLVSATPNMLPTQPLRNVTPPEQNGAAPTGTGGLTAQGAYVLSPATRSWHADIVVSGVAVVLGVLSLVI
jgi:Chaperone for protein-folding within the ER, fungal